MPKQYGKVLVLDIANSDAVQKATGLPYNDYDFETDSGGLETRHLEAISKKYEKQNSGSKLIHVFAANSGSAKLPPSKQYIATGNGQAKPYESGQAAYRENGKWKDGKQPIEVVGIPTIEYAIDGKKVPSKAEIEHYIAGLYFQAAKGNGICLPIRPINSGGKNNHQHPKRPQDVNLALPKNKEYSFGGGVTSMFGPKWGYYLEDELNKLDSFLQLINKAETEGAQQKLIANLPVVYQDAFIKGEQNPKQEFLGAYKITPAKVITTPKSNQTTTTILPKVNSAEKDDLIAALIRELGLTEEQIVKLPSIVKRFKKNEQITTQSVINLQKAPQFKQNAHQVFDAIHHPPSIDLEINVDPWARKKVFLEPKAAPGKVYTGQASGRTSGPQDRHVSPIALVEHSITDSMEEGTDINQAINILLHKLDHYINYDIPEIGNADREKLIQSCFDYFKITKHYQRDYTWKDVEALGKKALTLYNKQPYIAMKTKDNPTPKIKNESTTIQNSLKALAKAEWELVHYGSDKATLEQNKNTSARLRNIEVSKDDRAALKGKQFLQKEELGSLYQHIYNMFDYMPIPNKTKAKKPAEKKEQDIVRYSSEPFERLYEVATNHIAKVFLLCPVLQERHQTEIINGFIGKIGAAYRKEGYTLTDQEIYDAVWEKLVTRYPYYHMYNMTEQEIIEENLESLVDEIYEQTLSYYDEFLQIPDASELPTPLNTIDFTDLPKQLAKIEKQHIDALNKCNSIKSQIKYLIAVIAEKDNSLSRLHRNDSKASVPLSKRLQKFGTYPDKEKAQALKEELMQLEKRLLIKEKIYRFVYHSVADKTPTDAINYLEVKYKELLKILPPPPKLADLLKGYKSSDVDSDTETPKGSEDESKYHNEDSEEDISDDEQDAIGPDSANANIDNQRSDPDYLLQSHDINYVAEKLITDVKELHNQVAFLEVQQGHDAEYAADLSRALLEKNGTVQKSLQSNKRIVSVFNQGGSHWIAYQLIPFNNEKPKKLVVIYKDSFGNPIDNNFKKAITALTASDYKIEFYSSKNQEQNDGVNCGIFAIKNMLVMAKMDKQAITNLIKDKKGPHFYYPAKNNYLNELNNLRQEYGDIYQEVSEKYEAIAERRREFIASKQMGVDALLDKILEIDPFLNIECEIRTVIGNLDNWFYCLKFSGPNATNEFNLIKQILDDADIIYDEVSDNFNLLLSHESAEMVHALDFTSITNTDFSLPIISSSELDFDSESPMASREEPDSIELPIIIKNENAHASKKKPRTEVDEDEEPAKKKIQHIDFRSRELLLKMVTHPQFRKEIMSDVVEYFREQIQNQAKAGGITIYNNFEQDLIQRYLVNGRVAQDFFATQEACKYYLQHANQLGEKTRVYTPSQPSNLSRSYSSQNESKPTENKKRLRTEVDESTEPAKKKIQHIDSRSRELLLKMVTHPQFRKEIMSDVVEYFREQIQNQAKAGEVTIFDNFDEDLVQRYLVNGRVAQDFFATQEACKYYLQHANHFGEKTLVYTSSESSIDSQNQDTEIVENNSTFGLTR